MRPRGGFLAAAVPVAERAEARWEGARQRGSTGRWRRGGGGGECGLGVIARPPPESLRPGAWRWGGGAAGGVISVVKPLPGTGNPGGAGLRV